MAEGHFVVRRHFAQGVGDRGTTVPLRPGILPDLNLSFVGIGKRQRLALLKLQFIPRQRIQQGRGQVRQLQASLDMARMEAHQCADLRRCFAVLLKGTKTNNLLGRMHVLASAVLDHRGRYCQLYGQDFHRNKRRVSINHTA
ncbi:hypothetical protein D3C76_1102870 [compost metagenome]